MAFSEGVFRFSSDLFLGSGLRSGTQSMEGTSARSDRLCCGSSSVCRNEKYSENMVMVVYSPSDYERTKGRRALCTVVRFEIHR